MPRHATPRPRPPEPTRSMLASEDDIHVTTEADTVREAIDEADRTRPDVVVMDVRLADGSGIEATREIRAKHPATRVLMLTSFADDESSASSISSSPASTRSSSGMGSRRSRRSAIATWPPRACRIRAPITRATYELLKDEFVCRRRGTILVKGKGRMETWYLVGPRSDDGRTDRSVNSEAREPSIGAQYPAGPSSQAVDPAEGRAHSEEPRSCRRSERSRALEGS
jgi:CheY-like chemotaxis protein